MIVLSSDLITSLDEALAYYRARLVGDHAVLVKGMALTVRFNAEEIHTFTEEIAPGRTPRTDMLVTRRGGGEIRVFSLRRARLFDRIIPTICDPARVLKAKEGRGRVQIIGPAMATSGERLTVVLGPESGMWFVRTAFPLSPTDFARQLTSKPSPAPWPPK